MIKRSLFFCRRNSQRFFLVCKLAPSQCFFDFRMSLFSEFEVTDTYVTKQLCSSTVSIHTLETAFQSLDGMTVEVSSNLSPFEIKAPAVT